MHHCVYIHPNVEKQLDILKLNGKGSARMSGKAKRIIERLCRGTLPAQAGRLSKNGDARLKGALKYDLGKGCRMVCLLRKRKLMVLFLGDHDACETFMENLKNKKPWNNVRSVKIQCGKEPEETENRNRPEKSPEFFKGNEPDYDDILMERVSQEDLRTVFSGLASPGE